jgi:hypothetical protein
MSLCLKNIIDSLISIPLNTNNLYDKNIYEVITKLDYIEIDNTFSYLMNQTKMLDLINLTFSSYKIDCSKINKSCELIIKNFNKDDENEWTCILQHNLGIIFLDIVSHTSFINFINLNKNNRYLCIPVSLSPEFSNTKMGGHATCLIIDNALEEVYFFDSNGETNYFNYSKTYKIDRSNEYVNMLFNKYFEDLYYFHNIRYKFVSNIEYNPSLFVINRVFEENNNGNGNCMIISFLFPHYLLVTQNTISNAIKVFGNLKNNELLELIKLYYIWFYELMLTI